MKDFSQLEVTMKRSFIGPKIYIENILGKPVIVEFFDIRPSKKNDGTDCLYMQIKMEDKEHVVFSSSTFLMNVLKQLSTDDFPFTAMIIRVNRHFEFRSHGQSN